MNYDEYDEYFEEKCREIESMYKELKHEKGWRFLMSSRRTLAAETKIALIALNPGGDKFEPPMPSCDGSAYLYEKWIKHGKSKLQEQVKKLFEQIAERTSHENYKDLLNNSLSAQYIPFRSKDIKSLLSRPASEEFSKALWKNIFSKCIKPKLVITLSDAFYAISTVLQDQDSGYELLRNPKIATEVNTKWNDAKARFKVFQDSEGDICTLVGLPHLSRYQIFSATSKETQKATEKILDQMTENF